MRATILVCLLNDNNHLPTGLPEGLVSLESMLCLTAWGFLLVHRSDHVTLLLNTFQWRPSDSEKNPNSWWWLSRPPFLTPFLLLSLLFTVLRSHWLPCCSSDTPGSSLMAFVPAVPLKASSCILWTPSLSLQASAQMLPFQWDFTVCLFTTVVLPSPAF